MMQSRYKNGCKVSGFRFRITDFKSRFFLLLTVYWALSTVFSGCSSVIRHTLAPDYNAKMPKTVAVLPVEGGGEDKDAQYLFRTMAQNKLIQMGYSPISLETVDDRLIRSGMRREEARNKTQKELAAIFGVDSILHTTITEWDNTLFLSYASQKIEVKFALYDGAEGGRLWEAEFNTKGSDMGLERDVIELGVIKAYEPVIQRIIDAAFSTMPDNKMSAKGSSKKTYYDWLP